MLLHDYKILVILRQPLSYGMNFDTLAFPVFLCNVDITDKEVMLFIYVYVDNQMIEVLSDEPIYE